MTKAFILRRQTLRAALPFITLMIILIAIFYMQPRAMSYFGLNLLFKLTVPIALATLAQMFVITGNDLDLSIGSYVSLIACIGATLLFTSPLLGVLAMVACILAYTVIGALVHLRNLPSIIVTLGMSFVWLGAALILLPTPGGQAPEWLTSFMQLKAPLIPTPIIFAVVVSIVVHLFLMRSAYGVILRGLGGNMKAIDRARWSTLYGRMALFTLTGVFGALAGLALVGTTTSADANLAGRYTLLSIAGVILGGGEFVGGRVSPIGAVVGAMTLAVAGSLLTFLRIPSDWQIGAQGAILIIVLSLRVLINRFSGGSNV